MDVLKFFASARYDFLAVTLFLIILVLLQSYHRKWKNIPPGPYGLPIVGYMPFLTNKPHVKLMELGKKYGDIISVKFGSKTVVVLNSGEIIREAFSKTALLGRPDQKSFFIVPVESPFFDNGEIWHQHRRFAYKMFKELDAGSSAEFHMKSEIENLMKVIDKQNSKPFDMTYYLGSSVANYISALIFGKRYEFKDPEREILDKILNEASSRIGLTSIVVFFPWFKSIGFMRKILHVDDLLAMYKEFTTFTNKKLQEHKENPSENRTKDFIDFYFSELSSGTKSNTSFSEKLIPDSMQILYGTGSETVRTTLMWCFYTIAVYQDAQKKVQQEIDEVIGNRSPSFSDQKSMPYTQSVLMEIQRWQTIVPLGVVRMSLEDTKVAGYWIPKGTFVMSNLWAVHRDPRCWDNPDEFIPNRFLNADGTQIIKNINYMPFSFGKRNCMGERTAVVETFLYFACILQRYKLMLPEGQKPNFDGIGAITYHMKPQEICFVPRDVEEHTKM